MKKRIFLISIIIILLGIGIITLLKYNPEVRQIASNIIQNNINSNFIKNDEIEKEEKNNQAKLNEDNTINFPDDNLEKAIKSSLKITDKDYKITKEEAEKVTDLNMENCNIENIAGIEYFKNLKVLNVMKNKIKDISNIKNLTNLEKLFLEKNMIKDISAISNLKKLKILNIGYNEITDISPIKDLENIDYPFINGNPITNFNILYDKVEKMSVNYAKTLNYSDTKSYVLQEKENKLELYRKNQIAVKEMEKWVNQNIKSNMTDLEKEYTIINHILEKLEYATDGNRASEPDIYGTYINGNTVCFGYALIFQYLANFAGLENYKVETQLSLQQLNSGMEDHTWNIVKIEDTYYQVDLTWVDSAKNYKYVNISNETMELYHHNNLPIFRIEEYPKTNEDMPIQEQVKYYADGDGDF